MTVKSAEQLGGNLALNPVDSCSKGQQRSSFRICKTTGSENVRGTLANAAVGATGKAASRERYLPYFANDREFGRPLHIASPCPQGVYNTKEFLLSSGIVFARPE